MLINQAKEKGVEVFDLQRKKANKRNIESYLKKQNPELVLLNGHGNDSEVLGQNNKVLLSAGTNTYLLAEKTIYIRARNTGETLGPKAIKEGAIGFIGYKKPFFFWSDINSVNKPLDDELVRPFLECSNQVGLSLIKGHTAKEAHIRSMKLYRKEIVKMLSSESSNTFMLADLVANMRNQVCYDSNSVVK